MRSFGLMRALLMLAACCWACRSGGKMAPDSAPVGGDAGGSDGGPGRGDKGGSDDAPTGGGDDGGAGPPELPPRRDAAPAVPWVWGPVQTDDCSAPGKRQISAALEDVPAGVDPQSACENAPRNLMGIDFARPDRCAIPAGGGVRGEWDVPDTSCAAAPPPAPARGGEGSLASEAALEGYADLHIHQMGHLGFGGTVLWGAAYGAPADVLGPIPSAMKTGHDRSEALFDNDILGGVLATATHSEDGYPTFASWPDRTLATHQQAYEDWLHRAYVGGLRLMVMLAVNSEDMFGRGENDLTLIGNVAIQTVLAPGRSTNDMETLEWQVREAYRMQALIDSKSGGAGRGWYRIVRDPEEAGAAIAGGRLAVVLGTELQHLFNCDSDRPACTSEALEEGLSRLEGMGVSYVFPIHHKLNQFGGPAQFNPLTNGPTYDCKETNESCSSVGLTDLGRTFVGALMAHGMLIDTEHMSWRALTDTLDIADAYHYPVMASHIHPFDMAAGPETEYLRKTEHFRRIFGTGGMVGVILGVAAGEFAATRDAAVRLPQSCGGADRWGNAYLYARALAGDGGLRPSVTAGGGAGAASARGGVVTLGSDWNGFSGWPAPRHGADPCAARTTTGGESIPKPVPVGYPVALPAKLVPAADGGGATLPRFEWAHPWDYNERGLAQVALMPEFIEDLRLMGLTVADLESLFRSARGFVDVWRTARDRQGPGDLHQVRWVPRSPFDVLPFESWDDSRNVEAAAGFPICRTRTGHALGFERAGACIVVGDGAAAAPPPSPTATRVLPAVAIATYHAGRCLDAQTIAGIDLGTVRQSGCTGAGNQQWQLRGSDAAGWQIVNAANNKCLDVASGGAATGTAVTSQNCAAASAAAGQTWAAVRSGNTFALRSSGGLCLEVTGQSRADGAAVALAPCSGAAHQQWVVASLRAGDYERLYQIDKNRIAWLSAADAAHPLPVTVDGTRAICRPAGAAHWLGAVSGASCVGTSYDAAPSAGPATTTAYETLFQAR